MTLLRAKAAGILLSVFFLSFSATLSAADSKSIQIKGSDTMVNLGQAWAEAFMEKNPAVSIAITGGGSGTGIAAILSGTCDIAQSSRDLSPEEKAKAGTDLKETEVAHDGIALIVHPSNPVNQLTLDQLADIFSGKIKNWNEVGGNNLPILVLSRERNSGTHVFFLEHVVRRGNAKGPEEFSDEALMMPSSQAITEEIKNSESGIGYVGIGYVTEELKVVGVGKTAEGPFLTPTVENILDQTYPVARPLLFLTREGAGSQIQNFIEFVLSPEGQSIVELLDFVPIKK